MNKISALAALTLTGLALATPAHADGTDPGNGGDGHVTLVSHRNPFAAGVCKQALGLIPLAAGWPDEVDDACNNREHVHHDHDTVTVTSPDGSRTPSA
jgi:hypothetical protein